MARKNWESLSGNYRARLERSGLTKSAYESGASLSEARGHAKTPEHPHQGKSQERYREYHERRQALERQVLDMKRAQYGSSPRWSDSGAEKSVKRMDINTLDTIASYDDLYDYLDDYGDEADDEADKYHE